MNAKTLVAVQTRLPRVTTPLVHFRVHVPLVTTQIIKADVKVTAVYFYLFIFFAVTHVFQSTLAVMLGKKSTIYLEIETCTKTSTRNSRVNPEQSLVVQGLPLARPIIRTPPVGYGEETAEILD